MNVLVIGGTGSFGNAFTERLVAEGRINRLVIFSRDEQKQEVMARKFGNHANIRFFIGDVRDLGRLQLAMRGIDTVVHAAALKIIPSCEYNPFEAVHTNIIGAENVCKAALVSGVRQTIALSTDKACSPTTLYGATKLAAERIFVAANNLSGNYGGVFSCARYGNIIASRGSVIPLFKQLAAEKRALPITHPDMTRFWMKLEQAVEFVLNALHDMKGGEIFIPRLPSAKITDVAKAIYPEAHLEIIGIRGNEKLHEVLLTKDEARSAVGEANRFIILRNHQSDLPKDWEYTSDTNDWWLTPAQIREMI